MKRALIVLLALTLAACGQVRPGHVGIKVNQFGSGAGVENQSLGVGTYFTPFGTTIIEYPVYTQTYTYSQNSQEGSNNNEEFTFQDKNGLNIESDIAVSYSVNPSLAPRLYSKFRVDAAGLVSGQIRNAIRDRPQQPRLSSRRRGNLRAEEAGAAAVGAVRRRRLLSLTGSTSRSCSTPAPSACPTPCVTRSTSASPTSRRRWRRKPTSPPRPPTPRPRSKRPRATQRRTS